MDDSTPSLHHKHEMTHFVSSFLNDFALTVRQIKTLVLSLVSINLDTPPPLEVLPDSVSITIASRKVYDDLKKTESMLRGHLLAKSAISSQQNKVSLTIPSLVFQAQRSHSNSCLVKSSSIAEPNNRLSDAKCNKETTSTYISRLTDQQNKSILESQNPFSFTPNKATDDLPFLYTQKQLFKKERKQSTLKQNQHLWKFSHLAGRIEEIRQNHLTGLNGFEQSNKQCLTIIQELKEQLKESKKNVTKKRGKK